MRCYCKRITNTQVFFYTNGCRQSLRIGLSFKAGRSHIVFRPDVAERSDHVSILSVPCTVEIQAPVFDLVLYTGGFAAASGIAFTE